MPRKPKIKMFKTGDKVKSKTSGIVYVVVGPSDRAFHGVHNFWNVKSEKTGYNTQFSTKELEPA